MENENKKSKKGLIILLAVVIIAVLIGVAYYFLRPTTPKDLFVSEIKSVVDARNNIYEKTRSSKSINSTITLTGNIETTNSEYSQFAKMLNEGKIALNVQLDTETKKASVEADIDYQNEDFLKGKVFYKNGDKNLYLYVQGLFDKYFKIDISDELEDEQISNFISEDGISLGEKIELKKSGDIIKNTVSENLKDEWFAKEEKDGMNKNTMKLTVSELKEFLTKVVTSLKDNENYLKCFEDSDKVKTSFEDLLDEIDDIDDKYDDVKLEISLYTKGTSKDIEKMEFKVTSIDNKEITFVINKVDKNNYTISADNIPEIGKATINIEIKNSEATDLNQIDVSDSVDINNMTQSQMMTLYTNLTKMKIYSLIAPFLMN